MKESAPGLPDYGLLLALGALWGGSFIMIKLAIGTVPPATITAARLTIGAAVLFLVAQTRTGRLATDRRTLGLIFAVGIVGNAAPFSLIAWGEEVIEAGLASILMGIMPIATLVMAHFLSPGETLTARKLSGAVVGFAGLVVLVGPAVLYDLGDNGIRQLAILGAAICYGVSAILTRRLIGQPRLALGSAILFAGALTILPVSLFLERPWTVSPVLVPITAVVCLGLFSTALPQLIVFQILDRQGAGFFGQVNLLVPLMGVFWALIVLGEIPQPRAIAALVLILAAIALARGRPRSLAAGVRAQPAGAGLPPIAKSKETSS